MVRAREIALRGALAGVLGTVAMTVVMKGVAPGVTPPSTRPREFPPKKVVGQVATDLIGPGALSDEEERRLSWPAHFGYGISMGALYGLIRARKSDPPAPAAGALFGLSVWGFGYAGWLPAIGVRETTVAGPLEKMPQPAIAHLVFGVATALAFEWLGASSETVLNRAERAY